MLRAAQKKSGGCLALALDARFADTPLPHLYADEPLVPFVRDLIEAVQAHVCAFVVNPAFYLAEGAAGMVALERIVRIVPDGIPIIWHASLDCTLEEAKLYARAARDQYRAGAITLASRDPEVIATFSQLMPAGAFVRSETQPMLVFAELQPTTRFALDGAPDFPTVHVYGRSVLYASKRMDFAEAAEQAAHALKLRISKDVCA